MKKAFKKIFVGFLFGFFIFSFSGDLISANDKCVTGKCFSLSSTFLSENTEARNVESVVGNVVRFMTFVIPSLAVLGVIVGGVMIMISRDDEDMLKKGKMSVIYSVVGLVISITAYLIIQLVQSLLYSLGS